MGHGQLDLVLKRTPWHGWYAPPRAAAVGGGAIGDVPRLLARPSQCTRHLRRETEQQVPLCMRLAESRRPGRPGHEQQQHRPGSDSAHGRPLRALVSLNWYRIFHCLSLSFTDSSKFKGALRAKHAPFAGRVKWHIALPQHGATDTNVPWIGAEPPGGTGFVRSEIRPLFLFPALFPTSNIASTLFL